MKLLLSWLKEYVNFKQDVQALKEKLIFSGNNVEVVENIDQQIVFDLEITPNRPDCLCLIGLAREVSALVGQKLKLPEIKDIKPINIHRKPVEIKVLQSDLCLRYTAAYISGIKVGPSPSWMQKRLNLSGIRPICNIVDITNYVMLEYGQPLHAFDAAKLHHTDNSQLQTNHSQIIVRRAKEGEKIVTLDGIERKLSKEMLVIADAKKAIGIAGVIGGANSEISGTTQAIVLESATFSGPNINKTGRSLGLRTEALDRFEKGLWQENALLGLKRAINLIEELTQGRVEGKIIDIQDKKPKRIKIDFDFKLTERLLGVKIPVQKMKNILSSLNFQISGSCIQVPYWRGDVSIPEDLVEEIGRIYGYQNIPSTLPHEEFTPASTDVLLNIKRNIKSILKGAGFTECYNYSFLGKDLLKKAEMDYKKALKILNPLVPEQELMRTSLIPSILGNISYNLRHFDIFRIFEIAKVYLPLKNKRLPKEPYKITGAIVGEKNLFYQAKGVVELLFKELGIRNCDIGIFHPIPNNQHPTPNIWHPGRIAAIKINNEEIGKVGEIHPEILKRFRIKQRVALFNLDFKKLCSLATTKKKYIPISKFPSVFLDLAVVIDFHTLEKDVEKVIYKTGGNLVKDIQLFDVYRGKQIGKDKKSLAFRINYQSDKKTLTDPDVEKVQNQIISALKKKLNAEIRA